MRSIDTGDSRLLIAPRVAETTTSFPSVEEGMKETSTGLPGLLTVTSWVSKPMEEKINVKGGCREVVNRKFPWSSVNVPAAVPLTATDTAAMRSLLVTWLTVPVMVYDDCEKPGK